MSWRKIILNEFVKGVSKLTLVADPDALLSEEKLAFALREKGFDVIEFNDHVEFRYAYESNYRSIWDQGEETDLVVILRLQDSELSSLPYDLLKKGRHLSFNLGSLFPNFSYPVIEKLDRKHLDEVYTAQERCSPERMGDNATKDFILRYVFGIAGELINTDVDLLRCLIQCHYKRVKLPEILSLRVIQVLRQNTHFIEWPLQDILLDGESFFAFLQERWPVFLSKFGNKEKTKDQVREDSPKYGLKYSGPDLLPFDHQDILVYVDNLFVEGKLDPIKGANVSVDCNSWIRSGIIETKDSDSANRVDRLFKIVEQDCPETDCRYSEWLLFASKWAELSSIIHSDTKNDVIERFKKIGNKINENFSEWLSARYSSLINLPPVNPAMLHHVPRYLAREFENSASQIALLVVDGLAIDQWVTIRQILHNQDANLIMRESATFAWIPTLTSISRQSIFAGKPPMYFPLSLNTTNNESSLWRQLWEGLGLSRLDIAYKRGLGSGDAVESINDVFNPGRTKTIGLVIDKVDKIMHGMQLGSAGMHNQIKQWCEQGYLASLIGYLLDNKYQVWLTSDHGNIECVGKGRPSEGSIAETRGERARIYPTKELRKQVHQKHNFAVEWQSAALPSEYYPLLAKGKDAFVIQGESLVAHGGISIEEVIVPFVKFERRLHR